MKRVVNYLVCATALLVALVLVLCGGLWSLCGLLWCGALYISSQIFPRMWFDFWQGNAKILAAWGWL